MKKTLLLTAFLVLSSITGYASTVVMTFAYNGTTNRGLTTFTGTYMGDSGSVNQVRTKGNVDSSFSDLVAFDGSTTNMTLKVGGSTCGEGGCLTAANIQDSHGADNTNKFFGTFGADMTTGNAYGGCVNKESGSYSIEMGGLSAGVYTLTMLVGRANKYGTDSTSYGLSGNIADLSVNLLDYSAGMTPTPSLDGTDLTLGVGDGAWALVEYTFTVTADNTTLSLNSDGTGNINALALASVPEPATASLGLLALGGLLVRRRRA